MGTGTEVRKDTVEGKKGKLVVKRGESLEARAGREKEQSGAEKGAPRNAVSTRTTVALTAKSGGTTNGLKRARKRVKSTKKEAVCQMQGLPPPSRIPRKSRRER